MVAPKFRVNKFSLHPHHHFLIGEWNSKGKLSEKTTFITPTPPSFSLASFISSASLHLRASSGGSSSSNTLNMFVNISLSGRQQHQSSGLRGLSAVIASIVSQQPRQWRRVHPHLSSNLSSTPAATSQHLGDLPTTPSTTAFASRSPASSSFDR